jgi:DNA helicase HerA-like ATPase
VTSPVEQTAALTVGTVESVAPNEIRVLLELDAPQATALNAGQPTRFPRINGFLLIPNESGALVGLVAWLGVERSAYPKRPGLRDFGLVDLPFPLRKMALVPLGTLVRRSEGADTAYELRRGVASYPSVGDPVLLPTAGQLRSLVEAQGVDARVVIGSSPLGADAPVSVDPDKLFGRHLAVLGNTGSGKSCSVAGLIRWSLDAAVDARRDNGRSGPPNARFIVLDPNGEYRSTFADVAGVRVFQVHGEEGEHRRLRVPAWIWNSHEWSAFAQAAPGTQRPLLLQGLRNLRAGASLEVLPAVRLARLVRGYGAMLDEKIAQGPQGYSGNFGRCKSCGTLVERLADEAAKYLGTVVEAEDEIRKLIGVAGGLAAEHRYEFGDDHVVGYNDFAESELVEVSEAATAVLEQLPSVAVTGGASEDAPLPFDPADMAGHLEVLATSDDFSQSAAFVATLMLRIRSMLADARLSPIVAPEEEISFDKWLEDYVGNELAANGQIAVLDLSMVPADVLHIVIAVVARVVFEALQRYRKLYQEELPTVLVLEEAHTFVQRHLGDESGYATPARMCRETFERIAREGRKFGLGLVLSSQRPSELSPTVLAQCNTFLLHRLVNDRDQDLVARLVPDNLGGLLRELPSLPSQQAIILGWATPVPVLVQMRFLPEEQRPRSADPAFWAVWTGEEDRELDWKLVVEDWTSSGGDQSA